jgi:hypothetical protein
MGFFNMKRDSTLSETKTTDSNNKSGTTTVVPSKNGSTSNLEKTTETTVHDQVTSKTTPTSTLETPIPVTMATTAEGSAASDGDVETEKLHEDQPNTSPQEDEAVYPSGTKLAAIVLALCLSVFLVALDNTIIATAIPKITDHFNSLGDVGWYGSSYLLTSCALQLFFGK